MIDIQAGKSTPRVLLDNHSGVYLIEGQSYPENSSAFYEPIIDWFKKFIQVSKEEINLKVKLIYLNTSSTKAMFYLFDLLDESYKKGSKIRIEWYYDVENEMAHDTGIDLLEDLTLPYKIIPVL